MQIYQNSPELRKNLDPNLSYGDHHHHNTALHYAAKHGMKHLLRTFLNDLGGNPNKRNAANETVLHCACNLNQTKSFSAQERRAACVQIVLFWKGAPISGNNGSNGNNREKADLAATDLDGNTPLHCAATAGLKRCVELLLTHSAPLFNENNDKLTPCDLAMKGAHHDIARLLESRMVFTESTGGGAGEDSINEDENLNEQEIYSGLRSQDLQEAKDQLLVDTSDMLKIPLFTAEALLRDNEWSREILLEKWMKDPVQCCQEAGVKPPPSISIGCGDMSPESVPSDDKTDVQPEIMCEICCLSISNWDQSLQMSCRHAFCAHCWETYLTNKIQDGDAHHILCPAYQCHILVPVELIEKFVRPAIAKRYLQFDIKAFVESNKTIKWCPMAGCGRAVRLPEAEHVNATRGRCLSGKQRQETSHAVDCGNAHFFCWECLGDAHAPCGCNQWQEWQMKIAEVKPEELQASCSGSEEAANLLWLVTNSKPCPNCKSPIQKNEGCNHMKCSKCKFDFCWVCQESWKQHSSATGGYFRCNRFEATQKADEKQGCLITEAMDRNNQMQEVSRFLHFYMRYKNHENSQKLEEPLLAGVRQKMEILASTLGLKQSTKFIEEGIRELLKARRVLCGSYVYGYYLEDDGYNKTIFEFMQNELEEITEKLSEMIARPYLKTPKAVIIQTTALARRKRHEFIRAVAQGLIPPETPPNERKNKKRKYLDIDLSHTSAWLRERQWPEYDSDTEEGDVGINNSQSSNDDYNVELVIALEMSRLQMIEDRMKQQQNKQNREELTISPKPFNKEQTTDDQLKLAIQLSLQETNDANGNANDNANTTYQKTNADLTVDCFLKSLANHKFDLRSIGSDHWGRKERDTLLFKPCIGKEDGRFRISDIHEHGFGLLDTDDYYEEQVDDVSTLRRSRSTGDLFVRRSSRTRIRINNEPRYHLDSDHSSQHDDKPEDVGRRLGKPNVGKSKQQILMSNMHHHTVFSEEEYYQGQSSVEDTTTSDSINVDMEVCNILESVDEVNQDSMESGDQKDVKTYSDEEYNLYVNLIKSKGKSKTDDVSRATTSKLANALKTKLCTAHNLQKTSYLTRIAVTKNIGLLQNKNDANQNDIGTLTAQNESNKNLRINISEKDRKKAGSGTSTLETDSSNEYESETGIPKSPTLYISGVSISRTPEPKSPGISIVAGRQSRSSSLSVPSKPLTAALSVSSTSLIDTPSCVTMDQGAPLSSPAKTKEPSTPSSNGTAASTGSKSKSASEPEREREMFCFPKSSTDGALSSVLHVQESNLSSDDFHEALFLLERSPKTRDSSKRRKKSKKKEKDIKDKTEPVETNDEEASSAL